MPFKFFNNTGQELQANLIANMPIGSIIDWAADVAPAGWLACDGSAISRSDYSDLFNTVGIAYGAGNGTTTFNIPDISGSIIYASLISRSGSSLLPVADGSVTTVKLADGSITAPKVDSTVAGYLALTSGATTRRWTKAYPNEQSFGVTGGYTDVPNTSFTISDVAGNLVFMSLRAEVRVTTGGINLTLYSDAPVHDNGSAFGVGSMIKRLQDSGQINNTTNTYTYQSLFGFYTAPTTRTTNMKCQYSVGTSGATGFIRNITVNVWSVTP